MPNITIDNLEKNIVKLSITVSQSEAQPYLEEAARRLSEQTTIPGFRPGKAGYDIVKQRFGEMKILEEALEVIVKKHYVKALMDEDIETVGSPKIDVSKLAPGNDIEFTAEVARMPKATDLADFRALTVDSKPAQVQDKDMDLALKDLRRMRTKEIRAIKDAKAGETDKVVVSMNMKKDGVPVEGGQSPNHSIYLNEDYYIPGLKDKVLGMKEGDERTFSLTFPDNHVQKMLAGSPIEFEISLKELYNLELPELDDSFAQTLGMKDLTTLEQTLKENLQQEKEAEEKMRQEKEALELIAGKSRFDDIPDLLVNEEINKMIEELKRGVESNGLEFDQYLKNLNKTLAQLKLDFAAQALLRIKVALVLRELAEQEEIEVGDGEIEEEIESALKHYNNEQAKEQVSSDAYRNYTAHILRNRKVIDLIRSAMVK
jgi:trigger factor